MSSVHASKLFNIQGAIALVTGGGTGIGLMCSRALAANGAKVYITGRRSEQLSATATEHDKKLDGAIHPLQGDVTSKSDLLKIRDEIKQRDGKLHILVNNAGIAGPKTKFDDMSKLTPEQFSEAHLESESFEDWDALFRTNTSAPFFATMAMLPLLCKGNDAPPDNYRDATHTKWSAAIINITSISGIVKLSQNHFAYQLSKAAANTLTLDLAHVLRFEAPFHVRVNAIAPGVFPSEMTTDTSGNEPRKGTGLTSVDTDGLHDKAGPPGRPGTEEDMANLVMMLATNAYVHGQIIAVDGGYTAAVPSAR